MVLVPPVGDTRYVPGKTQMVEFELVGNDTDPDPITAFTAPWIVEKGNPPR